ncbi:seminal metalloprotease 1-like [Condylostylus longicornis]|uniref:seminal metalloprotease 1-like n=1 Tax=Condylostylus longicornis TaxID=2530218 RepID=UPI00244DCAB6|nr:seminal metalloprotease 1-like [Condylostylus longicornis]
MVISMVAVYTLPIERNDKIINFDENGNYFEGDMNLNPNQLESIVNPKTRNGISNEKYRWPNRAVYYFIDKKYFNESQVMYILKGLRTISSETCIRFYPWSEDVNDYVNITGRTEGCYSSVGRQGGMQILNLKPYEVGTGCFRLGTIIHEMIHALGFYHQQSAADRDLYIKIVDENISEGKHSNFFKYNSSFVSDYQISYDYDSIMHYSFYAFSKNGMKTIESLDEDIQVGQRDKMSDKDIKKLNLMYECKRL